MKIVHFIPSIDRKTGGTAFYLQSLVCELGEYSEVYIITKKTKNPVPVEKVKIIYVDLDLKHYFSIKKNIDRIIKEIAPDIIHINVIWMFQSFIVHQIALKNSIKVVLSPHGMLEPWILNRHPLKKRLALFLYQKQSIIKADYIHVTAISEEKSIEKLGFTNNIIVIPNGIEVDKIKIKDNWEIQCQILFLSRLHEKKGVEILIEVFSQLKDQLKNYKLVLAGEGDLQYINRLKQLAIDKNISEQIIFIDGVYGELKWELFKNSDLFILPTYSENFGIVIAEALACGVPVITTKGTPWEELNTRRCGWWIENDVDSLKNAILKFKLLSSNDLEIMGRNGRELIIEKYNSKIIGRLMFNLYEKIKLSKL